jgi:hypothetical protein
VGDVALSYVLIGHDAFPGFQSVDAGSGNSKWRNRANLGSGGFSLRQLKILFSRERCQLRGLFAF